MTHEEQERRHAEFVARLEALEKKHAEMAARLDALAPRSPTAVGTAVGGTSYVVVAP